MHSQQWQFQDSHEQVSPLAARSIKPAKHINIFGSGRGISYLRKNSDAMDIPEERGPNDQRPHQPGPSGGYRPGDSDQYSQSVLTRINPMRGVKKFLVSQQEGSETPPSDRTDPFGFPVTSFFGSFTKAGGTSQAIVTEIVDTEDECDELVALQEELKRENEALQAQLANLQDKESRLGKVNRQLTNQVTSLLSQRVVTL